MATAKKLPSGSWRVQIFSHYEFIQQADGSVKKKRIYESFTCDDPTSRGKREANLPHFRFHDLRHYSASIMHAIGIPDQYIMARGGWKTDTVLKSVYRNASNDEQKKFTDQINSRFASMQHEMQHKK